MKKLLLIIALVSNALLAKSQMIYAYYEKPPILQKVGDTLKMYIDSPKQYIKQCTGYNNSDKTDHEDITSTFIFDYVDSKGRVHYKQIAKRCPRLLYCTTTNGYFSANPDYDCSNPTSIELNTVFYTKDKQSVCYDINGIKIDSPENYNGAMICEGKIKIKTY